MSEGGGERRSDGGEQRRREGAKVDKECRRVGERSSRGVDGVQRRRGEEWER